MVKLEERGRGKFKPAPGYNIEDVKKVLFEKIDEEMQVTIDKPDSYNVQDLHYETEKFNIVSLFCGAGGLDLGVELAGIDSVAGEAETDRAYENKKAFNSIREKGLFHHVYSNDFFKEALETYRYNFPETVFTHNNDIRKVKQFPKADIVLGGFPCPGFSEAGPRLVDDPRNFLYIHYIRCLIQAKPKFFIAENVKGMLTLGKGEVFRQIKQDFEAAGYRVYHKLVNARDYGVPQLRERVFLVGVRDDIDFEYEFPAPTHGSGALKPYVTLRDAIGDLEEEPGDYFTGSYSTIYLSRNRKKSWNDQSFTIQASGRQAPIHPGGLPMEKIDTDKWIFPDGEENNRRLSVKEIKRIQTFPDWYVFSDGGNAAISENGRLNKVYKQIGNAVPVQLARAIARPIANWLCQHKDTNGEQAAKPNLVPPTNVLIALENLLKRKETHLPTVIDHTNKNKKNSIGDLLEYYVKDAFCGASAGLENSYDKLRAYQSTFTYLGNEKNPPDFIIKHGAAVEVKKIEGPQLNHLALNSSFPKDYLYQDDLTIQKACRDCEDDFGGWAKKDMIYAVGNVSESAIHSLWFIYGDCYCADKAIYEKVTETIKSGVSIIEGVEFAETKELGRVNKVDPLGVTYLRIKGMWGIAHPGALHEPIVDSVAGKTNIHVLVRKETHYAITNKPNFDEFFANGSLKVKDVQIPDPNNPAKMLDAILYSATL